MKISHFFIILIIVVTLFSTNTKKAFAAPLNNIFTQGTYKVSSNHGDFEPGQYNFRFISKNSTCYVYIIDNKLDHDNRFFVDVFHQYLIVLYHPNLVPK